MSLADRPDNQPDPLDDFEARELTLLGRTRRVYVAGTGPAVIVMAEMPGIYPLVSRFARTVRDTGFTVWMPSRAVQDVLNQAPLIEALANKYANARDMYCIRGINYPVALEGALKTKEISYIHGEGFPAGELKHGPLALISAESPVVAISVQDRTYERMLGNISEVSARGSPVIAVGFEGDTELAKYVDEVVWIREIPPIFSPVPTIVVLQLWAYYLAKARGCPIDKPRNIAKTVTVE